MQCLSLKSWFYFYGQHFHSKCNKYVIIKKLLLTQAGSNATMMDPNFLPIHLLYSSHRKLDLKMHLLSKVTTFTVTCCCPHKSGIYIIKPSCFYTMVTTGVIKSTKTAEIWRIITLTITEREPTIKTNAYPWNSEGFLVVQCLSKKRLSVRLIYVHHRLTKRNVRFQHEDLLMVTGMLFCTFSVCLKTRELTMFQNLSKATTKPEHTPLNPLKVLMWTLTLILSSTHRCSSPRGLPLHTGGDIYQVTQWSPQLFHCRRNSAEYDFWQGKG